MRLAVIMSALDGFYNFLVVLPGLGQTQDAGIEFQPHTIWPPLLLKSFQVRLVNKIIKGTLRLEVFVVFRQPRFQSLNPNSATAIYRMIVFTSKIGPVCSLKAVKSKKTLIRWNCFKNTSSSFSHPKKRKKLKKLNLL